MHAKYSIEAYGAFAVEKANSKGDLLWIRDTQGYDAERDADSLKEAKRLARYLLSEDYRRSGEMSERLAYVQIMQGNDCVLDFWREDYVLPAVAEVAE